MQAFYSQCNQQSSKFCDGWSTATLCRPLKISNSRGGIFQTMATICRSQWWLSVSHHLINWVPDTGLFLKGWLFLLSHYQSAAAVSVTSSFYGFVYQVMYLLTFLLRCIISASKRKSLESVNGINALIKCIAKKFTVGINPGCYRREIVFIIWQKRWLALKAIYMPCWFVCL